jgi:pimeloyl-ACP methyl ester carboxylesterase
MNGPPFLATPDGPLALHWGGAEQGAPLLWVHGYTLDATLWTPLWRCLPEFRHLGIDLPGHGASRAIGPVDDLDALARAVLAVADAYGATMLVGMSFGGTVCLQAAAAAPTRFSAMLLAAPALPGGPEDQDSADCNQQLLRMAHERGVGPWLAERWLSVPPSIFVGAMRDANLWRAVQTVVRRHRWDELFSPSFVPRDTGLALRLARVRTPVRLLVGDEEIPSFARTADILRRILPAAIVGYVADAGHLALLERPAAAAAQIRDWLRSKDLVQAISSNKIVK